MKKQIYAVITLLLSSLFSEIIFAAPNTGVINGTPPSPQLNSISDAAAQGAPAAPNSAELIRDVCPPLDALVLNPQTQVWSSRNGWKSASTSFLRTLDSFVGAQWIGVGIGQVICVYTKTDRSTFPVTLQRSNLVPAPKVGGLWSADKGGYMECKSNDVYQCPFFVQVPKKQENVYEQLDFYKGKPVESSH